MISGTATGNELPDWAANINDQVESWVSSGSVLGAELLIMQNAYIGDNLVGKESS